ncbi:MAG TPA: histidinol-phosphate transaminase, partial [Pyrinomonadaceae bacterium]
FDVVPFRPPTHSSQIARLGFNENPLGPSPLAVQAIQSFASGVSRYPSDDGIELKLALAKDFGVDYTNVVLGNGASELLELVSRCFLSAGDEVIFCWPTFPMYASLGKLCGARNVVIPLREDRYDLDAIHDHINKRTKLIFITNPNNPSGTVLEQAEFESFIGSIPDHVVVVIDEAYIECLEPHRIQSSKLVRQNVLVVRTFSKIRGLAGLRVGYAVAQSEMVRILEQVRRPFNTNALAQAAALASLQDDAHLKRTLQAYETGRAFFYRLFEQLNLPYVRSVTNFVLVDVRRDSEEVYRQLLGQGFLVKPVPPTQLRVSIGLPEQNHDFGRALDDILRVAVRAQR